MIFSRILVATDGTDQALRGVEYAAELAARDGAELLLLAAILMPQHLAADVGQLGIDGYVEKIIQESLRSSMDVISRLGVGGEVKAVVGPPAEAILAEIEADTPDLVVMGRRSRVEPKDLILGDVGYRVARHVKVPILLVP